MRLAPILLLLLLTGCAALPRLAKRPDITPPAAAPAVPTAAETLGRQDADIVDVEKNVLSDVFVIKPLSHSDPLPALMIDRVSLSGATLFDAMRIILANRLAYTVTPDMQGKLVQHGMISAVGLGGRLQDVLDELSDSMGFFYAYRRNMLRLSPDSHFVVNLPPVEDLYEGLGRTLQTLGAYNINIDKSSRMATFTATRPSYKNIADYLSHIRQSKSLLIFDTYIYQVDLSDGSQRGINWNSLSLTAPGGRGGITLTGGSGSTQSGGVALSTVYSGSRMNLDILLSFLQSQGTVKTLSQPKIAMITGTRAKFKISNSTSYVSQIGTTVTGTTGVTQTSVTTEKAVSGVEMVVAGDLDDGTVFADIQLKVSDLLRLVPVSVTGSTIQLPQTAEREIETKVRARPGDAILLAGINTSRDMYDVSGLPGIGRHKGKLLFTDRSEQAARSELVIVMRPRVVRFVKEE